LEDRRQFYICQIAIEKRREKEKEKHALEKEYISSREHSREEKKHEQWNNT